MERAELDSYLSRVDELASKIDSYAPSGARNNEFRADLAGLLVVSMASAYESCVKEILFDYASRHHPQFAYYTERNYEKLNSKIRIDDLNKLAKLFDDRNHSKFKDALAKVKQRIAIWTGVDITGCYNQVLTSRHSFAHAGERTTTIEEAIKNHRYAKHVIYIFHKSFSS